MSTERLEKSRVVARVIFGTIFVCLLVACGFYFALSTMTNPNVVQVENVFADVNGDGTPDLIVKASVILNTGQTNF